MTRDNWGVRLIYNYITPVPLTALIRALFTSEAKKKRKRKKKVIIIKLIFADARHSAFAGSSKRRADHSMYQVIPTYRIVS